MVLEGLIRVHEKPIYRGGLPKNEGGLGPSADLRGGLARNRRLVFLRGRRGGVIPHCTLC